MYELLLCHRRASWLPPDVFFDHWRSRRREVVGRLKPALHFTHYTQLERTSRFNVLYLAIRLSRSWPIVAALSVIQRLPLPALFVRRASDERWDVMESFQYETREQLTAALSEPDGIAALQQLRADALGRVRASAMMAAEQLVVAADPTLGYPRTVTRFCIRARRPLSHADMLERWRTSHKTLVNSLRAPLAYREYDQLRVDVATTPRAAAFDGVAVLAYDAERSLLRRLFDVRTQLANFRLVKDEVQFIDLPRSALVFGTEVAPAIPV